MARSGDGTHHIWMLLDHPPHDEEDGAGLLSLQFLKDGARGSRQVVRHSLVRHTVGTLEIKADKQAPWVANQTVVFQRVTPDFVVTGTAAGRETKAFQRQRVESNRSRKTLPRSTDALTRTALS